MGVDQEKRRRRRAARALPWLIAAGTILAAGAAGGFVTLDGDETRWTRNPSYRILNGSPDIGDTSDDRAIRASFQTWQDVSGSSLTFREVNSGEDISVQFLTQWPREIGAAAAGVTFTRRSRGVISSAEISLNNEHFDWSTDNNGQDADVQGITTHEVGHAIGLGHSYERDAVMYWSGSGPDLRALHPDDIRGARFLYGDTSGQGLMCDTCSSGADCASGGVCVQLEAGLAFCGQACGGGCPDGATCFGIQNSDDQCFPTSQFCSDDGGTGLEAGEYCWGASQCGPGLQCLPIPGGTALCSRECDRDAQCTNGTRCVGGFCLSGGEGAFGDPCESNLDCASLLCVPLDEDTNLCMEECDPDRPDCPQGADCIPLDEDPDIDGLCLPPGDVREGGACGDERCAPGLICILESEERGACRDRCEPFGTCPNGRGCTPFGDDNWFCLPTDGLGEGDDCAPSAPGCSGGLLCIPLDDDDNGMCFRPCDDRDEDFCGGDVACLDIDDEAGNLGICSTGDAGFAEPCANSLECRSFICVADGDGGSCTQPCEDTCPLDDWVCADTQSGDRICFPEDQVDPGNNLPGNNDPGNNDPGNNLPGNNAPGNNDPGNNGPGGFIGGNNDEGGGFVGGNGADLSPQPGTGCRTAPGDQTPLWPVLPVIFFVLWRARPRPEEVSP